MSAWRKVTNMLFCFLGNGFLFVVTGTNPSFKPFFLKSFLLWLLMSGCAESTQERMIRILQEGPCCLQQLLVAFSGLPLPPHTSETDDKIIWNIKDKQHLRLCAKRILLERTVHPGTVPVWNALMSSEMYSGLRGERPQSTSRCHQMHRKTSPLSYGKNAI